MRNLIRAELLPYLSYLTPECRGEVKLALAIALTDDQIYRTWLHRMLEGSLTPVSDLVYDERYFWLWVWDEMCHEVLPTAEELSTVEIDHSGDAQPEYVGPPPDWCRIFEQRGHVNFKLGSV